MADDVSVTIRPASAGDLPALGRLGATLVAAHHAFDTARFIAPSQGTEQAYSRFLAGRLGEADAVVLVAEQDGQVVGYAYAQVEGPDYMVLRGPAGVIHDLVVDPAHRGRGVGGKLLEAALEALDAQGAARVVLSTAHQNVSAQRLFARAGFRPTMLEMTCELGGPNKEGTRCQGGKRP